MRILGHQFFVSHIAGVAARGPGNGYGGGYGDGLILSVPEVIEDGNGDGTACGYGDQTGGGWGDGNLGIGEFGGDGYYPVHEFHGEGGYGDGG